MSIKLKLSIKPPTVNTIWRHRNNSNPKRPPIVYKSKEGQEFEKLAKLELRSQYNGKILENPLEIKIKFYFKDKRERDLDNYNKGLLDVMTGIIYKNDSQIFKSYNEKVIGAGKDYVEIEIKEIE